MADLNQIQLANNMIIIIDSHKQVSERRMSQNSNRKQIENCHLFYGMKTEQAEERYESRSGRNDNRKTSCQVMNCYLATTIIYILVHLLLIGTTSSQATSQIKSIWVSREDLRQEQLGAYNSAQSRLRRPPPPISSERRHNFGDTIASSKKVELATVAKKNESSSLVAGHLHASASSLQPVAIEPEASDQSGRQPMAQRRSAQPISGDDSAVADNSRARLHFRIAHLNGALTNLTDELATSLDHQWLRQNHNPATNMSASVSNDQVHFDEDSRDHYNNSQLGASKLYTIDTNDRRQDVFNATESPASNFAPKHETFDSQVQFANKTASKQAHNLDSWHGPAYPMPGGAYESDDLNDSLMLDNRTTSLTFARTDQTRRQNFSQHTLRDLHSPEPSKVPEQPVIYYLPDGDKWNQPEPGEHNYLDVGVERIRRHRHNHSSVPLDEVGRQRTRRPTHGNGDSFVFPASNLDEPISDIITARPIETVHGPPPSGNADPPLSYGFVHRIPQPSHLFYAPGQGHQITTTTPVPTVYPADNFVQDLSGAMKEQIYLSQYGNPTTVGPPLTTYDLQQPRRQAPPTILPQTLHQFISAGGGGGTSNYLPVPLRGHNNNRAQAATRVINLGEVPHGGQFSMAASGPKTSLFRNYTPIQLMGGGKTKKSLLSTINEKFNTWTGSASDSDVRHLIENSFYEQQQNDQTRRRRRRPVMTQSGLTSRNKNHLLTNGYNLPPPPLMYGPIRQPTVAPASSTLGNFYGGYQTSASVNHHISRPANHNQRHQNQGGHQQAANFIPVVAVQVTRTSPAPNAQTLDSSSQADKLDDQYVAQQSTDSLSANEIDEYLNSRTGQLSASKQHQPASNLNDKQKWDDSYGSGAAATTGQRYQNSPYYQHSSSPKARRRQVVNSSPGRAPQHETTIKSAVFGYLPHQADAPLLQAMNMLQQLPVNQVRHHHHHTGHLPAGGQPKQSADQVPYSGELYANQMDKSQQAVEAATPPLDYQSLAAVAAAAAAAATANQQQQQPFQASSFQATEPEEQPISLALQLQANNYLQNDIAHPFGPQMSGASYQRVANSKHAPLDVIYPSSGGTKLHYPAFQFMSPSQLGAYQEQLSQMMAQSSSSLMNQNSDQPMSSGDQLSASTNAHHPFQSYSGKHSEFPADNHLLASAPNDLNPLLLSPLFYQNSPGAFPPADQFNNLYQSGGDSHHTSSSGSQTGADQAASQDSASQEDQSSGDQDSHTTTATSEGSQRNPVVNSKGKKRSSDFFANAGQLLLSALPLLLAPTLGLMFASSPANPVARFHGSQLGQASGGLPGSLGVGQSHGGFANGMPPDDGIVMNASPAPQLFTPSPPGGQSGGSDGNLAPAAAASNYPPDASFSSLLMDKFNVSFGGGGEQTATMAPPPTTTTSPTSATSKPPNQYYKTSNSLPALTGFRLEGPTRKSTGSGGLPNRSAISSTTTNRPFAIIVTTLGPLASSSNNSTDLNSSASGGGGGEFGQNRTTPTILVFESQGGDREQSSGVDQSESLESLRGHYDGDDKSNRDDGPELRRHPNTADQQADNQSNIRRSSSAPPEMTTRASNSTIMYDTGYEGADFDAQFATLRKNNLDKTQYLAIALAPSQSINERRYNHNHVKDKSHYQYDEPGQPSEPPAPSRQTNEPTSTHNDSNRFDDLPDDSSASNQQTNPKKLYPVSSWPPMRRKTVSLITSSGNKTLLDSSDRYAGLMAATGVNGHSRNRVSQNSKRNKLSVTGSQGKGNDNMDVGGRPTQHTTVIYDDDGQPLVAHRTSSRLEVGNQPNLAERRHSLPANSFGTATTTTTTRQQLNKKRLNTLDKFVVESARPEDLSPPTRLHRRRKRALDLSPLEEPVGSNLIPGESSTQQVKSQSSKIKATGQVVKLKNKSRKLLRRVKKRTKRVERRQDTLVADHYSPSLGAYQNDTHLISAFNQTTDLRFPSHQDARDLRRQPSAPVNMTTTYEPGQPAEETLRRDASKSKSAIVTAMITHVAEVGDDDRDHDHDAGQSEPPSGEDSAVMSREELREQLLAKKMLLDQLATRTGATASASDELNYQQQADEQQLDAPPEFNAGGRGRFKPAPVLDYVPYGVDPPLKSLPQQNFSATRFINNRAAVVGRNKLRSRNVMGELNEDTKQALAKFGTLLLEDTLEQLPPASGRNETYRPFSALNRKRSLNRFGFANASASPNAYGSSEELGPSVPAASPRLQISGQYDNYEGGSATERYSTRVTQAPLPLAEDQASGWSRHYSNERANGTAGQHDYARDLHNQDSLNHTRPSGGGYSASDEWPKAAHKNERFPAYQYPHGRGRPHSQATNGDLGGPRNSSLVAELDARHEHFDLARTSGGPSRPQQSEADDNYAPGRGQREFGVSSQAVAFKTPSGSGKQTSGQAPDGGSPINKYNSFLMRHLGGGGANATGPTRHHNATSGSPPPGEQLDARYSTHSNYSTVAPAYHRPYAQSQESHPYDLAHHHHHDHHDHHPDDRYRDSPAPVEYPAHDLRSPRSPSAHYNGGDHYNSSYPPPPGTGHHDHQYRPPATHQATANYPGSYRDHEHHYQRQPMMGDEYPPTQPPLHHYQSDMSRGFHTARNPYAPDQLPTRYYSPPHYSQPQHHAAHHEYSASSTTYAPAPSHQTYGERAPPQLVPPGNRHQYLRGDNQYSQGHTYDPSAAASRSTESTKAVNDYLKRVQFSDSDRDKLMASYLTCDGLLNDNDHCLERLSCEFSDPQNIERANKLDRAVSSILLGHILINTYIPKAFKLRLKSASLLGYTQSGKCSKFACSKLTTRQSSGASQLDSSGAQSSDDDAKPNNTDR